MFALLNPEGEAILETPPTNTIPNNLQKAFAIIGTQDPDIAQEQVAYHLAWAISYIGRHIVRTGADCGVEQKVMEGAQRSNLEVFLPWGSYNRSIIPNTAHVVVYDPVINDNWTHSVSHYFDNASVLPSPIFALYARNFGIIEDCAGVIALPGTDGDSTEHGIRIAQRLNIPLVIGEKGTIADAPRFIGKTLQQIGLASPDLAVTLQAKSNQL